MKPYEYRCPHCNHEFKHFYGPTSLNVAVENHFWMEHPRETPPKFSEEPEGSTSLMVSRSASSSNFDTGRPEKQVRNYAELILTYDDRKFLRALGIDFMREDERKKLN